MLIELHPYWCHLPEDNVVDHVVCLQAESRSHTFIFNYDISVLEQIGISFNCYLTKVWSLFDREFPRVLMT